MTASSSSPKADPNDWKYLVALSGEAGRAWLSLYKEPEPVALEKLGVDALLALRRGQLELGRSLLTELEGRLSLLGKYPPSIGHVHQRWYFGVLAYYEYSLGRHESAEACLQSAYEAICDAIEAAPFLILLANHCQEFRLHQARIARGRHHWEDVRRYIDEAARMIDDQLPLCILRGGREIYLSDMRKFCADLPTEGTSYLADTLDPKRHRALFDHFVQSIFVLPGFVLVYP